MGLVLVSLVGGLFMDTASGDEPPQALRTARPSESTPASGGGPEVTAQHESVVRGPLDPTFSGDGIALFNPAAGPDFASGVTILPDGSIVMAGGSGGPGGHASGMFGVVKMTSSGQPDTTFGRDGFVSTNFSSAIDYADDVAQTGDGDLVVVGSARIDEGNGDIVVARYDANGALDPTFDRDGKVTIDFGGNFDQGLAIGVQADSKIVVAGLAGAGVIGVARLNPNGRLDRTFSRDGKKATNLPGDIDVVYDLAFTPEGRIVVVGETISINDRVRPVVTKEHLAVVRYQPNGNYDRTFGDRGVFIDRGRDRIHFGTTVAIQDDGSVVVAGGDQGRFCTARLTSSGVRDSTFDIDGRTCEDFSASPDTAWGLAIQANGAVVVGGIVGGANERFGLQRLHPDGTTDDTWVGANQVITDITGVDDGITDLAIQDDGKIVVVGYAANAGSFVVARYLP